MSSSADSSADEKPERTEATADTHTADSATATTVDGAPRKPRKRSVWMRIVTGAALLFTAWHVFASFLWIAPSSPLRDVVPGEALREYMIPMFGQSWSVFAPAPINGDYYFDVRALVGEGEDATTTEWIRASDVELSIARHNLFPPRSAGLAVSVASDFKGEWDDLNDPRKRVVALNYFEGDDWSDRLESELAGLDDGGVSDYMEAEETATAYATQVAYAVWGDEVSRVQFHVTRQNVVPFSERNDPDAERPGLQPADAGWRGLVERPGQSREQFADYFCSAPEAVCR